MTCMERADLFLLDAVGGLTADESAELRSHLAEGCCVCAGNAAEAAAVVAQLAQLLPPETPSAELVNRLMAKVNAPAVKLSTVSGPTPTATFSSVALPSAEQRLADSIRLPQSTSSRGIGRTVFAAGLAAGLAVVCTLAVIRSQPAEPHVMGLPDLKYVSLAGAVPESHASGRIFWDADHHLWHVYVFNLTPPPRGQQYELWFINKAGEKRPAGLLTLDNGGSGRMLVNVPGDAGPLALAAITNEPIGGSPQPTGSIQLKGGLD